MDNNNKQINKVSQGQENSTVFSLSDSTIFSNKVFNELPTRDLKGNHWFNVKKVYIEGL